MEICLLSGWGNSPEAMRPLADLLDRNVKTCIQTAHDYAASADSQSKFIGDCGDGHLLAGWSLGGLIALNLALQYPRRFKALIVISTPARFCSAPDYRHGFSREQLGRLATQLNTDAKTALRDFFKLSATPQTSRNDDLERRVTQAMQIGTSQLLKGIAYLERTDLRSVVSKIEIPLLVMHGRKDPIVPWRAGKILADLVPNSQWELHPFGGHDLPLQSPAFVSDRILEFIRALNK